MRRYAALSEFIFRWVLGTVLGWLAAMITAFSLALAPLFAENSLATTVCTFIVALLWLSIAWMPGICGAVFGIIQWRIALRHSLSRIGWAVANALVGFTAPIGVVAGIFVSPPVFASEWNSGGAYPTIQISNTWFQGVAVIGILAGAGVGLPQWVILQSHIRGAGWWIVANMLGGISWFVALVAVVSIFENDTLAVSLSLLTSPLAYSLITGLVLFRLLQNPKYGAEHHNPRKRQYT